MVTLRRKPDLYICDRYATGQSELQSIRVWWEEMIFQCILLPHTFPASVAHPPELQRVVHSVQDRLHSLRTESASFARYDD